MVRSFIIGIFACFLLAADKEDGKIYSPAGKRDPFRALPLSNAGRELAAVTELERFGIDRFSLRAILRTDRKATALFEDPEGKTHILSEGDHIGRERASISRILQREVILTIRTVNYLGSEKPYEKTMALPEK